METDNLMQLFWNLSSVRDEERLAAAESMIKKMSDLQCSYESSELQYCLQRLVKGLASNRKGARHGYFITLTELLRIFSVPVGEVFRLIRDNLVHIGNVKAQEERGAYFGRVFGFLAVVESGKLKELGDIEHLAKGLMTIYYKKTFLQEFCAVTVGRLICKMEGDVIFQSVLPYLGLDCGWISCTPGKLYLLLTLQGRFPCDERLIKLLSVSWNCSELLSQENLKSLSEILLDSTLSHPHIHAIWPLIVSKVRGGPFWRDFWRSVVDDSLLVSGRERKYLCYKLIENFILPSLELDEVGVVFSPRLIKQVETNGATKHHLLHDAAQHLLGQIVSVGTNSVDSLALAMQLKRHQSINVFNEAVKQLLSTVTVVGVAKYINHLIRDLWTDTTAPQKHGWMHHELCVLLKSVGNSMRRNREWLMVLAKFLFLQSFLVVLKPIPELGAISEPVLKTDRARYSELLAVVMGDLSNLKCKRVKSHDQSCDLWPVSLVLYIEDLLRRRGDSVELVNEINTKIWNRGVEVVLELNEKEIKDDVDHAFLYLLSVNLLDLLKGEERTGETVEEILTCYGKRVSSCQKTPVHRTSSKAALVVSLDWLPVLMDLLLGLLSYRDLFWRNVTERVFLWLKGSLTDEAIQVIIKAIEPQQLEEVMEREEGREQTPQEEMDNDAQEGNSDEEDTDPDGNGGCDEDVLTQGIFHDVGAEFRADVRNALGDLAAVDSDQESITSLNDGEMEALDSALAAVFHKKREKTLAKKEKKNDEITLMHFKMRVLDLIGVYIRHQHTNPLMLEFISPLLTLSTKYYSHKTLSPLSEKSRNVLDKLCRVKSYPRDGVDVDKLHLLLKELITKRLYSAQRMSPLVTQCCMFLLRVLKGGIHKQPTVTPMVTRSTTRKRRNLEKGEAQLSTVIQLGVLSVDRVVEWCAGTLYDAITNKNCNVQVGFFITLCERQPKVAWRLLPFLAYSLKKAGNHFRKIQGYNILRATLWNFTLLTEESVVSFLSPVLNDLSDTLTQELLSLTTSSSSKLSHHLVMVEAFSDLIVTAQSYRETKGLVDVNTVSKVVTHLSSCSNQKVLEIVNSINVSFSDNESENESHTPLKKPKVL